LRNLVLIVLTSVLIASAIEPGVKWLVKNKFPRLLAVITLYVGLAAFLTLFFIFFLLPLINEIAVFAVSLPDYLNSSVFSGLADNPIFGSQALVQGLSSGFASLDLPTKISQTVAGLYGGFSQVVKTIFGGILNFVLIIVISFYLAVQENGVGKFLSTITPLKHRKYVIHLWKRSEEKIGLWMQGQLLLMVIIAILVYLGLMLLGIQHALILAFLAGLFEIIPMFGPVLSAVPAVIFALVNGGVTSGLIVVGFYIIIHQFENQLIYPLVVKKVVGVNPIIVIIALIAGFELAGFLGLILSVPFSAVLMEFLNDLQMDKIEDEKIPSK
jgi:predicted PurR-regulated permease PerM